MKRGSHSATWRRLLKSINRKLPILLLLGYTLLCGARTKKGRKKKSWFKIIILFRDLKLKIDYSKFKSFFVIWNCFKPYFEIENWFRLRFDHAKEKIQIKKNFFPKYTPTHKVLTRLFSESIPALLSLFCGTQDPIPHKHPGKRCSARWR